MFIKTNYEDSMKKIIPILLLFSYSIFAQDDVPVDTSYWNTSGVVGFNISQVALSNWSQGGENSLAYSLVGNAGAKYDGPEWVFDNSLKISYGRTKLGEDDFKNTDNEVFMDNLLSKKIDWIFSPYISNTARTVIASGYAYEADTSFQISKFFDPGYLNQGIGLIYDKTENFSARFGLGFKETFTSDYNSYSDDPETTEIEKFKFETGIEFVAKAQYPLTEIINLKSELFLFSTFSDIDIWDLRWDTTLMAKLTDLINVNINVLLIYDKDETVKTQLKEALQLGISYNLF